MYNAGVIAATISLNFKKFTQGIQKVTKSVENFGNKFGRTFNNANKHINNTSKATKQANNELKNLDRIVSGIIISQVFYRSVNAIQNATGSLITFMNELEKSQIALEYFLGSPDAAKGFLYNMKDFAATTAFDTEQALTLSRRLMAGNFDARQVRPVMEILNDANAATGATAQQMDRIVLALTQLKTNGKIAGQEMRQFAEAGIPIYEILSEQLGIAKSEILQIGEMKIDGDLGVSAVLRGLEQRYKGAAERIALTVPGLMETIRDDALILGDKLFEGPYESLKGFLTFWRNSLEEARKIANVSGLGGVFEYFVPENLQDPIRRIIASLRVLADSIGTVMKAFAPSIKLFNEVALVLGSIVLPAIAGLVNWIANLVNATLGASPLLQGLVAAIIGLLVANTAARSLMFLWKVMRFGMIAQAVSGAVTMLGNAIRYLSLALVKGKWGVILVIAGALVALISSTKASIGWLSKLGDVIGSYSGIDVGGILQPEQGDDLDAWIDEFNVGLDDMYGNLNNASEGIGDIGDAADKAGKAVEKKFTAAFDEVFQIPDKLDEITGSMGDIGEVAGMDLSVPDLSMPDLSMPEFGGMDIPDVGFGDGDGGVPLIPAKDKPKDEGGGNGTIWPDVATELVKVKIKIDNWWSDTLKGVRKWAADVGGAIGEWATDTGLAVGGWVADTGLAIGGWATDTGLSIGGWATDAGLAIGGWVTDTGLAIGGWATDTGLAISGWVTDAGLAIGGWATDAGLAISTWATTTAADISTWVTDTGLAIGEWITTTSADIGTWATDAGLAIGEWVTTAAADIGTWVTDTGLAIGTWVTDTGLEIGGWAAVAGLAIGDWITTTSADIGTWVTDTGLAIGEWATTAAADIGTWVTDTGLAIGEWVTTAAADISTWVTDTGIAIGEWAITAADDISTWVTDTGLDISNWVTDASANIGEWATTTATEIGTWVTNTSTNIGEWATTTAANIGEWVTDTTDNFIEWAQTSATNVGEFLLTSATNVGNWVTSTSGNIATWVTNTGSNIKIWADTGITNVAEWGRTTASNIAGWVTNTSKNVSTWTNNALGNFGAFANGAAGAIANWATGSYSNVSTWLSKTGTGIYNWAKSSLGTISDWARNAWDAIANVAEATGEKIRGAFGGVSRTVRNVGSSIGSWAADNKSWLVPVGIGAATIGAGIAIVASGGTLAPYVAPATAAAAFGLSALERGGIVSEDQLIRIGEGNKREAVIPMENSSYMRPFSQAVASDLKELIGGGLGSQQQDDRPILYVGTLIADDRSLTELERRMKVVRTKEEARGV